MRHSIMSPSLEMGRWVIDSIRNVKSIAIFPSSPYYGPVAGLLIPLDVDGQFITKLNKVVGNEGNRTDFEEWNDTRSHFDVYGNNGKSGLEKAKQEINSSHRLSFGSFRGESGQVKDVDEAR